VKAAQCITLSLIFLSLLVSCEFDKLKLAEDSICIDHGKTLPPAGYTMHNIGSIPASGGKIVLVQFLNEKIGYALGRTFAFADAKCFRTSNGGKLWTRLSFSTPHAPRGMIFFDEATGIITLEDPHGCPPNCPEQCITLRTQDGGDHWAEYFIPNLTGSLSNLQLDSMGNVYAFHGNNFDPTLMKSGDQGLTWEPIEVTGSPDLQDDLLKIVNERLYVIDRNEALLVLDTNGDQLETINTGGMIPIDFEVLDNDSFIMADENRIIRSNDRGNTWETIYNRQARIIGFSTFNNGLAILNKLNCPSDHFNANDVIASTIDGGRTWIESEYNSDILQDFILSERLGTDHYLLLIGEWVYELKSD
jgi:photosystem II stability/assembly factor-like uncharacterized protein